MLATGGPKLESGDFSSQKPTLYECHIHLEHFANALELAGLTGLSFCAKRLALNFKTLVERGSAIPRDLGIPFDAWGGLFLDYLQEIASATSNEGTVHQLIDLLSQDGLPVPLDASAISEAKSLFNISDISKLDADAEQIPTRVTEPMASLAIGKDVRPELLQGMLIELPEQTRQFEKSIGDFLASKEFNDLKQAQRIAHTIKGAANVVSISGMANLTHFAEDLLETAVKNLARAPDGFEELLVRTSDCLAATAEYLNQQGPPPEELPEVMQLLLDWLNKLKLDRGNEDEESESGTATPTVEQPRDSGEVPTLTPQIDGGGGQNGQAHHQPGARPQPPAGEGAEDRQESDRYINLAEKTAQELLRISGEIQIANNRVNAQISALELSFGLTNRYHKQIKRLAAELEALIQNQSALRAASMKYSENEIDPLEMERFSELHTFSNRLLELTTDSYETIANIDQQIKDLTGLTHAQRQLNNDNQSILLAMNLVPVSSLSSRFSRCARQTCRLTGKAATFGIEGESLLLDSRVLHRVADPLMHLIRNAIDHGLETDGDLRIAAGKPAEGSITLSFKNRGDNIEIICQDDGAGFDYEKIKAAAVERGLLDDDAEVKEALLHQLVLMPGFSTRERASQTSGRGIGLDSVVAEIRSLKGKLTVSSTAGKGCRFTMVVPTSILTSHALLVECRDRQQERTYAIASRGINQVIYVDEEEIIQRDRHMYFQFGQEEIPVQTIGEMLGIFSLEEERIVSLLITQKPDGSHVAIGVEKVSASQDLVIKPLNRFSYPVPGVIGATILGDGTVAPVIDLQELPGMALSDDERSVQQEQRARTILAERANFIAPRAALVVDDSLSARRSLAQFVSDMGMEVYTAKDGFDAISVIEEKKPSLMLVDLEMPRMNGLELTAHLRSRAEYQDIPVIMITSRSTSRHKEMARRAGVTTYLTKPWSEDELLSCIQREIA